MAEFCVGRGTLIRRTSICWLAATILLAPWAPDPAYAQSIIAIDAGHSKSSPGAISARGIPEFEFNVGLSEVIFHALSSDGARPILIKADRAKMGLRKRTELAKAGGATFFLSIHHDSAQPQYFQQWNWQGAPHRYSDRYAGYSLFVSRANVNPAASLRCASALGEELRRRGFPPSPHHAEKIPGESRQWADEENGVYYYDNLSVLKNAPCPALLFEAGIIVNRDEEVKLQDKKTRQAIAAAVKQALSACGMLK